MAYRFITNRRNSVRNASYFALPCNSVFGGSGAPTVGTGENCGFVN